MASPCAQDLEKCAFLHSLFVLRIILCKFAVRFLQVAGRGFEPPDLQVMGLTSCLCSTPHRVSKNLLCSLWTRTTVFRTYANNQGVMNSARALHSNLSEHRMLLLSFSFTMCSTFILCIILFGILIKNDNQFHLFVEHPNYSFRFTTDLFDLIIAVDIFQETINIKTLFFCYWIAVGFLY